MSYRQSAPDSTGSVVFLPHFYNRIDVLLSSVLDVYLCFVHIEISAAAVMCFVDYIGNLAFSAKEAFAVD